MTKIFDFIKKFWEILAALSVLATLTGISYFGIVNSADEERNRKKYEQSMESIDRKITQTKEIIGELKEKSDIKKENVTARQNNKVYSKIFKKSKLTSDSKKIVKKELTLKNLTSEKKRSKREINVAGEEDFGDQREMSADTHEVAENEDGIYEDTDDADADYFDPIESDDQGETPSEPEILYVSAVKIVSEIISEDDFGTEFNANIVIEDVVDMNGFEFRLSYDPDILIAKDVVLNDFLGKNTIPLTSIDNARGKLAFAVVSTEIDSGFNGSGTLATIAFYMPRKSDVAMKQATTLEFDRVYITNTEGSALMIKSVSNAKIKLNEI